MKTRENSSPLSGLQTGQKDDQESIVTLGDGNCAYNAFALGLCDLIFTDQLQSLPDLLLARFQRDLSLSSHTVSAFKQWIMSTNEEQRQSLLAPILRQFIVDDFILAHYEGLYQANYEAFLIGAFERFLVEELCIV